MSKTQGKTVHHMERKDYVTFSIISYYNGEVGWLTPERVMSTAE